MSTRKIVTQMSLSLQPSNQTIHQTLLKIPLHRSTNAAIPQLNSVSRASLRSTAGRMRAESRSASARPFPRASNWITSASEGQESRGRGNCAGSGYAPTRAEPSDPRRASILRSAPRSRSREKPARRREIAQGRRAGTTG